jgi:hypothetical protein
MQREPPKRYRELDAAKIVSTIATLKGRIDERFPGAGLGRVCAELQSVADLRATVGAVLLGCVVLITRVIGLIDFSKTTADSVYSILQGIEATMNILVLMGAAALFLVTIERRIKRERALEALHELRSIAHVIDMHQLTKDPSSGKPSTVAVNAEAGTPQRALSAFELSRYLDYCSELLSLTAKVAALYAQSLPDAVVTEAVSDLERVTSNMSQKVWQKIMIIESHRPAAPAVAAGEANPASMPVVPAAAPGERLTSGLPT